MLKLFKIFEVLLVGHLQDEEHAVSYATLARSIYDGHVITVHDFNKTRLFFKSHGKDMKIFVPCNYRQKPTLKFGTLSLLHIIFRILVFLNDIWT